MVKNKKIITTIFVVTALLAFCIAFVGCVQEIPEETTPKEFVIQYADDAGMHQINVTEGMPYSLEEVPAKAGYKFLGLFDAQVGGTQYVADNGLSLAPFTDGKNLVLFPQYKANDYTIVLDYQGAQVMGERQFTVAYGESLPQLPKNLMAEHKTFSGWYTHANCQGTQVADQYGLIPVVSVVNNNNFNLSNDLIYLYAGFEVETYTVTCFFEAGMEAEEFEVKFDTPVSQIVPVTRVDGKAPLTWSKTQGGEVFNGKITGDTVLYALEYAPVIDFDSNGGNKVKSIVTRAGDVISLSTPIRENYKFMGWETAGGTIFNATAMPDASVKLSARWQAMIVFNTNGGKEVTNISESQGTKITLPVTEKAGYIFAGWYSESGEEYTDVAMPGTSIVLRAKYRKILKETKVLIDASSTRYVYGRATPSVDESCIELDLSELYNNGVRSVSVKMTYENYTKYASSSNPKYTYLTWYSTKTASDAFKIWQVGDKHVDKNWGTYSKSTQLNLSSKSVYICFWASVYDEATYWRNFYIEIEYPDMSSLY